MNATALARWTAFAGHRRLASGPPADVAIAARHASARGGSDLVLIFDDRTGRIVDVDMRGTDEEVRARIGASHPAAAVDAPGDPPDAPRRRGRPRLGVVAREVTLLPRHWDWLNAQPGGASVALRRLVEEARRATAAGDEARRARDAAYHVMHALAGDLPAFEEASRALFAHDASRFRRLVAKWPRDVRTHLVELAFPAGQAAG